MSFSDLMTNTDFRSTVVAFGSILLSVIIFAPSVVPVFRWITSNIRLHFVLHRRPANEDSDVSVSGLFVHPVKSLRAISIHESTLDRKGLTDDRRFMVVYESPLPVYKKQWDKGEATHRFLTQRQCPSLATISATIETTTGSRGTNERVLVLCAKDSNRSVRIPLSNPNSTPKSYLAGLWDDVVAVDDMGDEAAAFLQAITDIDEELSATTEGGNKKVVRLVTESKQSTIRLGRDNRTYVPDYAKTWNGTAFGKPSLTDGFPILIASEASLNALNQRLLKAGKEEIPMSRFRPNIVVKGPNLQPFEEDRWKVVAIGDVVFAVVKACPRCKQSCTDQITGEVSPQMEPVETMKSFRRASGETPENGAVFFAQNAIPIGRLDGRTVRVGDSVRILERGDPVYID